MAKIRKKKSKKALSEAEKKVIRQGLASYPRTNTKKPYKGPELDNLFQNFKY